MTLPPPSDRFASPNSACWPQRPAAASTPPPPVAPGDCPDSSQSAASSPAPSGAVARCRKPGRSGSVLEPGTRRPHLRRGPPLGRCGENVHPASWIGDDGAWWQRRSCLRCERRPAIPAPGTAPAIMHDLWPPRKPQATVQAFQRPRHRWLDHVGACRQQDFAVHKATAVGVRHIHQPYQRPVKSSVNRSVRQR